MRGCKTYNQPLLFKITNDNKFLNSFEKIKKRDE